MEGQVHEWVQLPLLPKEAEQRQKALIDGGFIDILEQMEELQFILNCYLNAAKSNSNLQLAKMHIGGAEPIRVLKLEFIARLPETSDEECHQFHALFDSHVTVKLHKIENEVKRTGYLMDIFQQPSLQLRPNDSLLVYL